MKLHEFAITLLFGLSLACGGGSGSGDASPDGDAAVDAPPDVLLPDGPRGDVLRVPESEAFVLPTLTGDVQVLRTEAGVANIYAENARDLRVVQGFVTMRDRYFQFEAGRRLGLGKLSELLGAAALGSDQEARGRGMTVIADRIIDQLTPEQGEMFDAYVEGINAYIRAVKANELPAPTELRVVGPILGARRPGDVMEEVGRRDLAGFAAVAVLQLGFDTTDPLNDDIVSRIDGLFAGAAAEALRRDGVRDDIWFNYAPVRDVSSANGFGLEVGGAATAAFTLPSPHGPAIDGRRHRDLPRSMVERLLARNDALEQRLHGGRSADFGSNVWATMGRGAADGAALLSGDGHLPLAIPTLFYQMGLDTSVFGGGDVTLRGLFFAGIPPMAVGTNGAVAWSQTFLVGDITDWYTEEVTLDAAGAPASTLFQGSQRDIVSTIETYVVRDVPALGSVGRTEMTAHYATFDGRRLASIEGRVADADTTPGAGETIINVHGDDIIPGDTNGDGVISAISFDYTALDLSNILLTLQGFNESQSVDDFREASRRFVAYAQNLGAADIHGDVYYGGYNATPCRSYLPRQPDGRWVEGADPTQLLDGTQYAGFEVVLDADGMPDEAAGASDAQRCIVPFDDWPSARNPDRGFIANANNDLSGQTFDGRYTDDEHYIAGPRFAPGFRAQTIEDSLTAHLAAGDVTVEAMTELQGDHHSPFGLELGPSLLAAIERARTLADAGAGLDADEQRLADAYTAERTAIDEVAMRLAAWIARGAIAESGVETFYESPTAEQRTDAVATMIWNEYFRRFNAGVFDDEGLDFLWAADPRSLRTPILVRVVAGRGATNPEELASFDAVAEESVFFDVLGTPEVEQSEEVMIDALVTTLEALRAAPDPEVPGVGGFGTDTMDEWLWGLRHMVRFDSLLTTFAGDTEGVDLLASGFAIRTDRLPLADDIVEGDPRFGLEHFPRPGDFFAVDAANPSFLGPDYQYALGPVMRMVIRLAEDDISGQIVIPGGQSGLTDSPHFDDQGKLWLANETMPFRFHVADVVAGAESREVYRPAAP